MLDNLVVIGVNHDSASVELREQIAFAPEKVHDSLNALISETELTESVILSTCNRTEVYVECTFKVAETLSRGAAP